ncbi:hypothetical protein F66182_10307 [Fusarium sp. NRRL 66182]|nr:hypothetical protein F66182_10307 [Fusarium sp. NRRL 66182]
MGKLNLSVAGLTTQASQLNMDGYDTGKHIGNISRYQCHPYARFDADESKPDVLDKNSLEYRQRVEKVLSALDEVYQKTYKEYQAFKAEHFAMIEDKEQNDWNAFILNPARGHSLLPTLKLEGVDQIDYDVHPEHSPYPHPGIILTIQRELYTIEKYIELGQRELARLDKHDSFIYMRNKWVGKMDEDMNNKSVESLCGRFRQCGSDASSSSHLIDD